jgi:hypothetical protein
MPPKQDPSDNPSPVDGPAAPPKVVDSSHSPSSAGPRMTAAPSAAASQPTVPQDTPPSGGSAGVDADAAPPPLNESRVRLLSAFSKARGELTAALNVALGENFKGSYAETLVSALNRLESEFVSGSTNPPLTLKNFKGAVIDNLRSAKSSDLYKQPLIYKLINALLNIVISLSTFGVANAVNYYYSQNIFFAPLRSQVAKGIDNINNTVGAMEEQNAQDVQAVGAMEEQNAEAVQTASTVSAAPGAA